MAKSSLVVGGNPNLEGAFARLRIHAADPLAYTQVAEDLGVVLDELVGARVAIREALDHCKRERFLQAERVLKEALDG